MQGLANAASTFRRKVVAISAASSLVVLAGTQLARAQDTSAIKGDRALGEYLSNTCVACHQLSGVAKAGVPPIMGWPEDQFIAVMRSYKEKVRDNDVMQTIAAGLSAEDLAGLAAFFGSIKPAKPAE